MSRDCLILLTKAPCARLAHRIRDMQTLPYCVVANPHFNEVYELYYEAFDRFRRVPEVRTLEDNDSFCEIISNMLKKHLSVIPKLAMGILETSAVEMLPAKELDGFMNAILRSVRCPLLKSYALTFDAQTDTEPHV